MMFNIVLITKLLIIIFVLIIAPVLYITARIWWFTWTMKEFFLPSVLFSPKFFIYKTIFILFICNLIIFIITEELLALILLIHFGIIY